MSARARDVSLFLPALCRFFSRPRMLVTCGILGVGAISPAAAFNLGQIEVHSHLGQPFDATVRFSTAPGEVVDAACFALVPRNPADGLGTLPPATIEVIASRDGGEARIRSRLPVREPAVGIGLRATCAGQGEFRRDFAITLDPAPSVR